MTFYTDNQTLNDLSIFGKNKKSSIYGLFNKTCTNAGARLLESMFKQPISDLEKIRKRLAVIRYFHDKKSSFPFMGSLINNVENYLGEQSEKSRIDPNSTSIQGNLKRRSGMDLDYKRNQEGIMLTIRLINSVRNFVSEERDSTEETPLKTMIEEMKEIVDDERLAWTLKENGQKRFDYEKTAACDTIFRFRARDILSRLMTHLAMLDAYIAVAQTAIARNFTFPIPLPEQEQLIDIKGLYHPFVENAVTNDLTIDPSQQIIFLTGANMAGKSTFMKAFGVILYLAHMGFPVPARSMEFSLRGGLYTTINLPDQLKRGYSHFYTEVQRVKKVAELLDLQHDLVIIFDELFRGTNVKDAYDGTYAVTEAFAKYQKAIFMISTHITEAGVALKEHYDNILFTYFSTLMEGEKPVFPHTLQPGISEDRFGMRIINNERIIEIIQGKVKVPPSPKEEGRFFVDKQTINDLELFGKFKDESVFNTFNRTVTQGGSQTLELLFMNPITDAKEIERRREIIRYFQRIDKKLPVGSFIMKEVNTYFNVPIPRFKLLSFYRIIKWRILKFFMDDAQFDFVKDGILSSIKMLDSLNNFLQTLDDNTPVYQEERSVFRKILESKNIRWWKKEKDKKRLSYLKMAHLDYRLRRTVFMEMKTLERMIYEMDAYLSVANVANEKHFTHALLREKKENFVRMEGLYHPHVESPVANSIQIDTEQNVFFLTGANMAGKSTFMKAFGIAIYLAHLGFPVPAQEMEFSLQEGMYTSINLSDNLLVGYSHFYSEVLRVKTVAEELNRGKRLVLIMDELFKGTNVKDAFDATVAVSMGFAESRDSLFLLSTHIIEAANDLKEHYRNVQFFYFPTRIEESRPVYPYLLEKGITSDRHGMRIINNEEIIETINNSR